MSDLLWPLLLGALLVGVAYGAAYLHPVTRPYAKWIAVAAGTIWSLVLFGLRRPSSGCASPSHLPAPDSRAVDEGRRQAHEHAEREHAVIDRAVEGEDPAGDLASETNRRRR